MKTNYNIEIQRRNVTPAQFLAYVRRRLKATGGDAFCGCLDLDYFAAGSEPNYDTERDGTHCISHSKPYSMQTYIRQDGRLYNEICEFEFDDEKTGHGYYYLIDAEEETAETDTDTTDTPDTAETTERAEKENTMKTYEITFSNGNDIYSANLVIAESAEQATAYYTAKGREVIGCDETMSRPKPGQPVVTVPEGWTAPAAETETETAPAAEPETETETAEIAERAAEIADALDDIRHARLAYGYTTKRRVTARCIREAEKAGYPTVRVGYCDLRNALSGITPDYYTAGQYGWNCDVYRIAGLNICTGYRPAAGVPAVGVRELAGACRGADAVTRDRLFAAWIVTNREIAREGARA